MRGWNELHSMSKALYEDTYFLPNEDYEGWLDRVARSYQNDEAHGTRMKEYISNYWFHPSTPISSNAGTDRGLPISCFTKTVSDDKTSIFQNYNETFNLGAHGGGIGTDWSSVREVNHSVGKHGGTSSGIIPFMGISDRSTLAISQGGLRRASEAVYLDISHPEIEEFIDLRKPTGDQNRRAPNLHHGVVITDDFMNSVIYDKLWDLVSPKDGSVVKTVKARKLWEQLLEVRTTLKGEPYLLFIDTVNELAPEEYKHENIKVSTSNLCTEIMEVSNKDETAVCNLASIALPMFIETDQNGNTFYNFEKLHSISRVVTFNLNRVIDVNYYPTEKTKQSNNKHRPIGIGVQGLADTFILMNYNFDSSEAKQLNKDIFETIYHAALEESCSVAKLDGPYSSFNGSPASQGILQFDMWNVIPSNRYNWDKLKNDIQEHGLRNSLLLAPMPTASTSQILGYNECIEPITSNIYSRRTLAGEFILANKYLMRDLIDLNLWSDAIKNNIIANNGSIQQIETIPEHIRNKYKTVWEIPMRSLIDMAADRGAFICQSQSLNLWLEDPTYNTLTSMHFYSWKKGLKTGIYYLRRRGKHQAQQFTIEPEKEKHVEQEEEICEMCSA